ncbi:hypothetical protein [Saliphagus sp. LR7]|nr:hypothetical protein [Saliphagus sp. LR7]
MDSGCITAGGVVSEYDPPEIPNEYYGDLSDDEQDDYLDVL